MIFTVLRFFFLSSPACQHFHDSLLTMINLPHVPNKQIKRHKKLLVLGYFIVSFCFRPKNSSSRCACTHSRCSHWDPVFALSAWWWWWCSQWGSSFFKCSHSAAQNILCCVKRLTPCLVTALQLSSPKRDAGQYTWGFQNSLASSAEAGLWVCARKLFIATPQQEVHTACLQNVMTTAARSGTGS